MDFDGLGFTMNENVGTTVVQDGIRLVSGTDLIADEQPERANPGFGVLPLGRPTTLTNTLEGGGVDNAHLLRMCAPCQRPLPCCGDQPGTRLNFAQSACAWTMRPR